MSFVLRGITRDGRSAEIEWFTPRERRGVRGERRGLVGDPEIVRDALLAEARGETVSATATGPALDVDLDDAEAALVLLGSLFLQIDRIDGDPPRVEYPVPDGAVA